MTSENLLLCRLDKQTLDKVLQSVSTVELEQGQTLADPHQLVQRVYFPYSGMAAEPLKPRWSAKTVNGAPAKLWRTRFL